MINEIMMIKMKLTNKLTITEIIINILMRDQSNQSNKMLIKMKDL